MRKHLHPRYGLCFICYEGESMNGATHARTSIDRHRLRKYLVCLQCVIEYDLISMAMLYRDGDNATFVRDMRALSRFRRRSEGTLQA